MLSISPDDKLFPLPQREGKYYNWNAEALYVNAAVLYTSERKLILIQYDLFGTPFAEKLRATIAKETDIPMDGIVLFDTYNHCAPREDLYRFDTSSCGNQVQARTDEYFDYCLKRGVMAAKAAVKALQPAYVKFGKTDCPVNINRDQKLKDTWILGKNPHGPSNHSLSTLRIMEENSDSTIAILVNFALYGNMCCLAGLEEERSLPVSGDLPGRVCELMREQHSAPVLFLCGAAGDQDPLMLSSMPSWQINGDRNVRQMTWCECQVIREYQAQWIIGCIQEALRNESGIRDVQVDYRYVKEILCRKDGKMLEVWSSAARVGSIWILAVSGAPGDRVGEILLREMPTKDCLLITHAGPFTGYLVDGPQCTQSTFESTNMVVAPYEYEKKMTPLIHRMIEELKHESE